VTAFTLIASFRAKPNHGHQLVAALMRMVEPSQAEPGCLGYRPMVDPQRPDEAICIEKWQSEAALQAHFRTAHFAEVKAVLDEILAQPFGLERLVAVDQEANAQSAPPTSKEHTVQTLTPAGISHADHLAIRVPDYDQTLAFYSDILGFKLTREWTLDGAFLGVRFAYMALGEFHIEVIGDELATPADPTADVVDHLSRPGYTHLCLRVPDLDATVESLKRMNVDFLAEPFEVEAIGQRLAMIRDNSGYVVELAQSIA